MGGGNVLLINDKVKEEGLAGLLALLLEGLDGGGDGGVDVLGTGLVVDGNGQCRVVLWLCYVDFSVWD